MAQPIEATDAFMVRIMEGRDLCDAGDYPQAEAHFRELLNEARDGHVGNHLRALSSLIPVYGRAGRYFEVHLMARRLAAVADPLGDGARRSAAFARGAICGALARLHRSTALRAALADFRHSLDQLTGPHPGLDLEYHSAAASWALARPDLALSREHLVAYRAILEAHPELPLLYERALVMSEARMAHHEGQHELAARLLERVEASGATPPFHRMQEMPLRVAVSAKLGRMAEARALAEEAIAILASVESEAFLASDRIHQGNDLARELVAMGATDMVSEVYDLVAAAVMLRLGQLDECMRALPELGMGDPETTAVLTSFRKEFLDEQHELLERIAALLETQGEPQVRALLGGADADGLISVCAWCESVRPEAGRWLPIGHFVPRESSLRVTHGICPTCSEGWVEAGQRALTG